VTNNRFVAAMAVLFVVLALASFAGVVVLLDDDDSPSSDTTTSTTTTASLTTTTSTGALSTPTFVAIVVSETEEATARSVGDELTEAGYDTGVLHSDDYESLEPGFWVAYVGPFDEVEGAQAAVTELEGDGYTAAYPRCVGTDAQCPG
jgi:hypothetical protein